MLFGVAKGLGQTGRDGLLQFGRGQAVFVLFFFSLDVGRQFSSFAGLAASFFEALLLSQADIMLEAGLGLLVCSDLFFSMFRLSLVGEKGLFSDSFLPGI